VIRTNEKSLVLRRRETDADRTVVSGLHHLSKQYLRASYAASSIVLAAAVCVFEKYWSDIDVIW